MNLLTTKRQVQCELVLCCALELRVYVYMFESMSDEFIDYQKVSAVCRGKLGKYSVSSCAHPGAGGQHSVSCLHACL